MKNKITYYFAISLISLFFGCKQNKIDNNVVHLKIDSTKVERKEFFNEAEGYGKIEPAESIVLDAKYDGLIKFNYQAGLFKKGNVVYSLTGPEIKNQEIQLKKNFDLTKSDFEYFQSVFNRKQKLAEHQYISQEAFDKYKYNYDQARLKFEKAKKDLDYFLSMTKYTAPFDGYLNDINVSQGAEVKAGQQLAKFQNLNKLKLVTNFYGNLTDLTKKSFSIEINEKITTGKILYYENSINPKTGGHLIWIELNSIDKLKPGDYVNYKFLYSQHFSPAVPQKAIVIDNGKYFVVTSKNGKYEKHEVTVGNIKDGWTEISSGIKNGDIVLTTGAFEVYYGDINKTMNVAN